MRARRARRAARPRPPARRARRRRPASAGRKGQAVRGVPDAAGRRLTDAVTRAARQVDADDAIVRTARPVARGIGRAEDRDDRRADRDREMHRAGVAGDQQIETLAGPRRALSGRCRPTRRSPGSRPAALAPPRPADHPPARPVRTIVAPRRAASCRAAAANALGSHCLTARPALTCTPTSGPLPAPRQALRRVAPHVVAKIDGGGVTIRASRRR